MSLPIMYTLVKVLELGILILQYRDHRRYCINMVKENHLIGLMWQTRVYR